MMVFYNLGIRLYVLGVRIASLFNPKAKKWIAGRKQFFKNISEPKNTVTWFHCASLGEFEQGRPIIEAWREKYPKDFILLTFFSPSGYEVMKDYRFADEVKYLPADTRTNARIFISHYQPKTVFFIKYEFWLNYIFEAEKCGANLYSVSAIFRENQRFFKFYGKPFRKALLKFNHFFVQDAESKSLLQSINITKCTVSGDTRYDRVFENAHSISPIKKIEDWLQGEKAFIIGSSWEADENLLASLINDENIGKIILAPHEVKEQHITFIESTFKKLKTQRYTKTDSINKETQLLIIDCIGILSRVYQYGKIAYVGGAFGSGLHNILEPSIFGLPVIFGPKHAKFPEAQLFINNGIGFSVNSDLELLNKYQYIHSNLSELQSKTKSFTENQRGAKEIIFNKITSNYCN
ncbi:MAG: 3-deoxy-D-manno-octulosonic acid transferase [Lishizhenia sp.]